MQNKIYFGVDLGSDSLKISFAFEESKEKLVTGKLALNPFHDRISACAYYDQDANKWYFADEIDRIINRYCHNIVKIKDLILLLEDPLTNYLYYSEIFPKFSVKSRAFSDAVVNGDDSKYFVSGGYSPKYICELFFEYASRTFIAKAIEALKVKYPHVDFGEKPPAIVIYPTRTKADSPFTKELTRLVDSTVFKTHRTVSVPKAVGLTSFYYGLFTGNSLIADIGESDMSLVKAKGGPGGIEVEGDPIFEIVGGRDFDTALNNRVVYESRSGRIEFGAIDASSSVREDQTILQEFNQTMRAKSAKEALSLNIYKDSGVIVEYESDVKVHINITREKFIQASQSVYDRICSVILAAMNKNQVNTVILSGGAIFTVGLVDMLNAEISKFGGIIITLDSKDSTDHSIYNADAERSMFAPSIGGAILGTDVIKMQTVTALSYGTDAIRNNTKHLSIFLKRGTVIPENGIKKSDIYYTRGYTNILSGEIYSTFMPNDFEIGLPGSNQRKFAIANYGLRLISGEGKIVFSSQVPPGYPVEMGVIVDIDGNAVPFVSKVPSTKDNVQVSFMGLDKFSISTNFKK